MMKELYRFLITNNISILTILMNKRARALNLDEAQLPNKIINALLSDPHVCVIYAKKYLSSRDESIERVILQDGNAIMEYIDDFLINKLGMRPFRWKEAEQSILDNYAEGSTASRYYHRVLLPLGVSRWKEAEPLILTNVVTTFEYCASLYKYHSYRWPKGEELIAKNGVLAAEYAIDVIEQPFPLGEPAILASRFGSQSDDYLISNYLVFNVDFNRRWIEGEKAIIKDNISGALNCANYYLRASQQFGDFEWPEGKAIILKYSDLLSTYIPEIMKRLRPLINQ